MKDLGMIRYFLGIEVWQYPYEIFLNKRKYTVEILKRFVMMDCKDMTTPMTTNLKFLNDDSLKIVDVILYRQIMGSLMYLTNMRLDIWFVVNTLSQYMVKPKHIHLVGSKHAMWYLKAALDYGLRYASNGEIILHGFTYLDWVGSVEDKNSTSRCCFSLGSCMISWFSKKKSSISLST